MEYLVQIRLDDNTFINKICKENEVIRLQNESDFNGIDFMKVFALQGINNIVPLYYKGWQPNCLIEFEDEEDNVIISGYGEDH